MASTGSPGTRWINRKTPRLTRNSTGSVATSRRRISWPTGLLLEPDRLEAHHAIGDRRVALHFRAERLRLDRVNDEDRRCLLAQDLNELAVQLLALGVVVDLTRLLQQPVSLGVRKTRPVERCARGGVKELVGVAVRIGPATPGVARGLKRLAVAFGEQSRTVDDLDVHGDTDFRQLRFDYLGFLHADGRVVDVERKREALRHAGLGKFGFGFVDVAFDGFDRVVVRPARR